MPGVILDTEVEDEAEEEEEEEEEVSEELSVLAERLLPLGLDLIPLSKL